MSEFTVADSWVRDLFESAQYTIHEHPAPTHVEWLVRDLDARLRKVLRERSEMEKRLAERDAEIDRLRARVAELEAASPDDAHTDEMVCEVCTKPLMLSEPKYVHADGKTYRHPIRPVSTTTRTSDWMADE